MGKSKRRVSKKQRKAQTGARARTSKTRMPPHAKALSQAWQNLSKGDFDGAESICKDILRSFPDEPDALYMLALVLSHKEQIQAAIDVIKKAIAIRPDHAESHWVLGLMLGKQLHFDDAIRAYQKAIELQPNFHLAYNNLGIMLQRLVRPKEAGQAFRKVVELQPDYAEGYNNLGAIFKDLLQFPQAIAAFRQAIKLKGDFPGAHHNLGRALALSSDLEGALAAYEKAIQLDPNYAPTVLRLVELKQTVCRWEGLNELIEQALDTIENSSEQISPFVLQFIPTTPRQQQLCTRRSAEKQFEAIMLQRKNFTFNFSRVKKPKLTIGYISPDFREHAAATLMADLFDHHDRDRFQIFAYALGPDKDSPMRRRFIRAFDKFSYVHTIPVEEAAQGIYDDGVDILVDLGGYTMFTRTDILALCPAPIQVNYLGSGATMGVDFMDYMIVDKFIVPPEQEKYFDEKLVYLPDCFMVNDSKRSISDKTPSRADCGLPEDGFVFCCFSSNRKITPKIFDVWMRILHAVPSAVLWLIEWNNLITDDLKREAEKRGIDPARVVFAPIIDRAEHMARYRLVDLFLDTLVVSAGATASDALLMGCPILACAGTTLHSRVAGSMLRAVGLLELITTSEADYERLALELAREPDRLRALRTKLKENLPTAPLFNCQRTTRQIESAFETMWDRYLNNLDPQSFSV